MPEGNITYSEAMGMNRKQRRYLASINKSDTRIPGTQMPIINKARQLKKLKAKEQKRLNETKM